MSKCVYGVCKGGREGGREKYERVSECVYGVSE